MSRVLVTQRLVENDTYPETRDALDVRWGNLLAEVGVVPLLVPSGFPPARLVDALDGRGLLLTGGNDLASQGGGALSRQRDELELALLDIAIERELPVLGVCRGAQLMAWRAGYAIDPVEGHVRTHHALRIDEASRYLGAHAGVAVNSYHDRGIRAVDGGNAEWRPVAWAPDGTVEGIEHAERPIVGIMWHPEREEPHVAADMELLSRLFG